MATPTSTGAGDVGSLYISLGLDSTGLLQELVRSEQVASGTAGKIRDRLLTVGSSLAEIRREAAQVKQALASAADFRVRGDAALDALHGQLDKVREAGAATDKTLDQISLTFEQASRGGKTYTQTLDKIASDKGASTAVRELARALSDEAKEANLDVAALQRRERVLNQQITGKRREFTSLTSQQRRQTRPTPSPEPTPEPTSHAIPQQAAASAAVRVLEGQTSIRAAERFLGGTVGLGSFFEAIFPIAGGFATIEMLTSLGEKVQAIRQAFKDMADEPQAVAQAFREFNGPLQLANDDLRISNDLLDQEIAKLRGKPTNGLAQALDEAKKAADQLADSLANDLTSLQKLLNEKKVPVWQQFLGKAGTDDLAEEIKRFQREDVAPLTDAGAAAIPTSTKPGMFGITVKPDPDAANAANRKNLDALRTKYLAELETQQHELLAAQTGKAPSLLDVTKTGAGAGLSDAATRAEQIKASITRLKEEYAKAAGELEKSIKEQDKNKLGLDKANTSIWEPYRKKIAELGGELEKLQVNLDAIGKTATAQTLAKAFGDAKAEIARENEELKKNHQALSDQQKAKLQGLYTEIETTKAEEAFRQKFQQTTDSISDRIAALKRLTGAIGQGYEAQRAAVVANQLAQEFPAEYRDPKLKEKHQGQMTARETQLTSEYDEQQRNQNKASIDKLGDQAELEDKLAAAERNGAEAVRQATLAQQKLNLERDKGVEAGDALAAAEQNLSDAQARRRAEQATKALKQETANTNRVTEAVPLGADAVRKAQLQNRVEEIRASTPKGPEQERQVQAATDTAEAQHRQEVLNTALQTGIAYQNQLELIGQQIAALERMKAAGNDTLAVNISLKNLEQERTRILIEQALQVGSVRDGMIAFFRDLANEAESSAAKIYGVMKSGVNSLNDTLSRAISGQKVSWASFFQGLSQQLTKLGLEEAEGLLVRKIGGVLLRGKGQQQGQAGATGGVWDEKIPGAIGGGFGGMLGKLGKLGLPAVSKRDGNSDATALIVTLANGSSIAIPQADKTLNAPFGKRDGSSAALALYVTVTNPAGQQGPNGLQQAGSLLTGIGMLGVGKFGGAKATGGDVNAGSAYLVGEQGPEILTGVSGRIANTSASQRMLSGSGGSNHYYTIDARGTDPALTEQRTRQAIQEANRQSMITSIRATNEQTKRLPPPK
jgi:hypothetical protein